MSEKITDFYSLTVRELLQLPIFSTSKLLAGRGGLDRRVSGINMTDDPDYTRWVSEGEVMISTLLSIHRNPQAMRDYIPNLARKGISAFFIKPHNYLNSITPSYMLEQADMLALPLIELPVDSQFSLINGILMEELTRRRTLLLQNMLQVNQMLTQTITEGADLDQISRTISDLSGGSILIIDTINDINSLCLTDKDLAALSDIPEPQRINIIVSRAERHELRTGQSSYGYLYIYNPSDSSMLSPELLSQILSTVPLVITREQSLREGSSSLFASFLFHILTDPIRDEDSEQARAEEFDLNFHDNHLLMHLRVQDRSQSASHYRQSFQNTLLIGRLRSTFSKLSLGVHIVRSNGEFLILLSAPKENGSFQSVYGYLPELIRSFGLEYPDLSLVCGIGCIHSGIRGIIQSDTEAKMAIKTAVSLGKTFVRYEELVLMRLIHASDPAAECLAYIEETLGPLIANDKARNSELMKTLDAYFQYAGNAKLISENLFTHYNTISYRLRNIQELTGKDLHIREDRFRLETALDLYKHFYTM